MLFAGTACSSAPVSDTQPATKFGGTVIVGLHSLGELDPAKASGVGLHLIRTACDGLTSLDSSTGEARPALAKNLKVEAGALKVTVELRPKLKFAGGGAVDAQAVRESLSKVARPATASPWASLLERVSGFAEVQSGQATHLTGVKVVAPLEMEISFTAPAGDFPTTLAHPSLTPISEPAPASASDGASATGTSSEGASAPAGVNALDCSGPYRVEPGASQGSFNLRKNPKVTRNGPDTIRVESLENAAGAYQALIEGKVDLAERPGDQTAIPTGFSVERRAGSELTYAAFDTSKPPGSDPNLVRAFSLALDRLVVVDAAFGDRQQPALRWLPGPPGLPDSVCAKYIRKVADSELAKQTLGGGPKAFALTYDSPTFDRFAAQAIQVQMKDALAVDVQLRGLEGEAFAASARDRAGGGAWVFETGTDLIPGDQGLFERFVSGRPGNRLGYSNAGIDEAFQTWRRATNEEARAKAIAQAEDLLCAETPAVPLWRRVHHWAFNPAKVKFLGEEALDTFGMPVLRNATGP